MSTINSVTAAAYTTTAYESKAAAKKENTEATTEKSYGKDVGVVYEKSSKTVENAGTYKKTSGKTNTALIEKMKADTANRTNQLRSMVEPVSYTHLDVYKRQVLITVPSLVRSSI